MSLAKKEMPLNIGKETCRLAVQSHNVHLRGKYDCYVELIALTIVGILPTVKEPLALPVPSSTAQRALNAIL